MDYLYIWQSNHQIGMFHPLFFDDCQCRKLQGNAEEK